MAIVYPVSGCIREFSRFGIADAQIFLYNVGKAIFYSALLNSAFFFIAIFVCCCFRSTGAAVTVTAIVTFVLSLYLGYGLMLKLPVFFLPTFQIREALSMQKLFLPGCFLVAGTWGIVLGLCSWRIFCKCDLK